MHFAIRYLTEYHYDAPGHRQPQRAARASRDDLLAALRRVPHAHRARGPRQPPPRLLRHRGARVRHPHRPRAPHDRRARAGGHLRPAGAAARARGRACAAPPTSTPPASSRCHGRTSRRSRGLQELRRRSTADSPLATLEQLCELIPDRFEYRPGVTYVGSGDRRPAAKRAPASARTSCTSRWSCCAAAASPRATSRATCGRRPEDGGADSLEVDTHAWLEALLPGHRRPRRAGMGRRRPHQPPAAGRDPREDRPRALLRGRAAGQGPVHGRRDLELQRRSRSRGSIPRRAPSREQQRPRADRPPGRQPSAGRASRHPRFRANRPPPSNLNTPLRRSLTSALSTPDTPTPRRVIVCQPPPARRAYCSSAVSAPGGSSAHTRTARRLARSGSKGNVNPVRNGFGRASWRLPPGPGL